MAAMNDNELYPIGDAARRSGLSVSAVRYYADTGTVPPTRLDAGGRRLYGIDAIARLELVRTLRELGTDLNGIRTLLDGGTTLHGLLTAHLAVVERGERTLRARGAVLRVLVDQGGATPARADLMHRLVSMADEEREQVVDDFWNSVADGLDVPDGFVERLRGERPALPDEPTADRLRAWIELADLLQDAGFRTRVRDHLRLTYSAGPGRTIASAPFQEFIHETGGPAAREVLALYRAGLPAASPHVREAATRFLEGATALSGTALTRQVRERMARAYLLAPGIREQIAGEDAGQAAAYDRYRSLVARINGTGDRDGEDDPGFYPWLAEAVAPAAGE